MYLQIVKLERFLTQNYRMGIIHLWRVSMGLKELAALPIIGLLVRNHKSFSALNPFDIYEKIGLLFNMCLT